MPLPPSPFSLSKPERLKSQKTIQQLFNGGKSYTIFPYRMVYVLADNPDNTQPNLQAAFSVSTRYSKRSNQRNRIKRQMRESYRLQKKGLFDALHMHQKQLSVMFIFVSKTPLEYTLLYEKMQQSLSKLTQWAQQNMLPKPTVPFM